VPAKKKATEGKKARTDLKKKRTTPCSPLKGEKKGEKGKEGAKVDFCDVDGAFYDGSAGGGRKGEKVAKEKGKKGKGGLPVFGFDRV